MIKTYTIKIVGGILLDRELEKDLKKAEGIFVDVTIAKHIDKKRTKEQGGYLFKVVYKEILAYYEANPTALVMDVMRAIKVAPTTDFIHALCKMMFRGGKSTAGIDEVEMTKHISDILEHHLHIHEHLISEPTGGENE